MDYKNEKTLPAKVLVRALEALLLALFVFKLPPALGVPSGSTVLEVDPILLDNDDDDDDDDDDRNTGSAAFVSLAALDVALSTDEHGVSGAVTTLDEVTADEVIDLSKPPPLPAPQLLLPLLDRAFITEIPSFINPILDTPSSREALKSSTG